MDQPGLGAVGDEIFNSIMEQCIYEVAYEMHREDKLVKAPCQICLKKCRCYVVKPAVDVFGNAPSPATLEKIKCIQCGHPFSTNRYAQHLEKCLGIGGRRAATRTVNKSRLNPNPSSPTLNDSDQDDYGAKEKKKRSSSPLPPNATMNKSMKLDFNGIEHSASSSIHNTPTANHTYQTSRETTPNVPPLILRPTATLPVGPPQMIHPMFAGKTKPGGLMAKNLPNIPVAGKMPVNGYGKVPRVLTPTGSVMLAGIAGGRVAGGDESDYAQESDDSL
ncbi:hypothetical protein HDU79_009740 [Rhizoclosmatium sp. JEL0117]|nr:hypothetical protein HDU79_009740 [Rhizoclosmatium sp. JEL0117]